MQRVSTSDAYTPETTERYGWFQGSVLIVVTSNPVYVQFAVAYPPQLQPNAYYFPIAETYLHPTTWTWHARDFPGALGIVGFRCRSAFPSRSAVITTHTGGG